MDTKLWISYNFHTSRNSFFPQPLKTIKSILISLARQKQAAGWFWLMGRNLLTLALVDLTEYGESRINVLGTLKNHQANIFDPKTIFSEGYIALLLEVIKYINSWNQNGYKLHGYSKCNLCNYFFKEVKIKRKRNQLDTCCIDFKRKPQ